MKTCSRCRLEKQNSDFHNKTKSKDGLESHCKSCETIRQKLYKDKNIDHVRKLKRESAEKHKEKRHAYQKNKYYENIELSRERSRDKYYRFREQILEKNRNKVKTSESRKANSERASKWRRENKEIYNAFQRIHRYKNKLKISAVQKVNDAIRYGKIIKPETCSKCNSLEMIQAHHSDYTKPLDIIWLCKNCHCKEHGKLLGVPETSLK